MSSKWRMIGKVWIASAWCGAALFTVFLMASSWPRYWLYIIAEKSTMGWLQSVLLFACAFAAAMLASLACAGESARQRQWLWSAMAVAFAMLMLDERLMLHERLRERFLERSGMKLLPWMAAGDLVMPIYALCGLAVFYFLFREMSAYRWPRIFLMAGVGFALAAVAIDSYHTVAVLPQTVEELLETGANLSFWSAMMKAVFHELENWSRTG
ncbi:hypothetical protein [Paenibacillus alkalitolerans]|uniref:hypothetical protein n=1 Tax=Paenibacillus alkalitolerans TaxID=2799335 RepID=UPI0018F69593|nr:hypothetical protein [Paenibacillus alkalitolerans]